MAPLTSDLRRLLEQRVIKARDEAEQAAAAAIGALAVERNEAFPPMTEAQRRLRTALRARAKQLGNGTREEGIPLLIEEVAYVQWHRMLFARFLAENHLLMHPSGVPTTLEECAELAAEEDEADAWQLAARYAGQMLPGIFRPGDPTAQIRFAPEGRTALERIIVDLPAQIFTADDSLGWVYQFWQTKRKEEVNNSGRKIGGADIAPKTQHFTEHYMVQFLLENSLGAWWATRHPESPLVKTFSYLRFREDGTPAAGSFPGWPDRAAKVTMIDPCCGSGHFLVAAFEMLRQMRMEEELLDECAAVDATLRDNIHGLELDPRCTQIAAFALAFAAWKTGGYHKLPPLNIACSGIPVQGQLTDWTKFAGEDQRLCNALERLYDLFRNAPELGSLINPADLPLQERMFAPDYLEVEPLLERALARERHETVTEIFGAAAKGVVKATRLLSGKYTLVATNVPFLTRNKQSSILTNFCENYYQDTKNDLSPTFIKRCQSFTEYNGTYSCVALQTWLSLKSYINFRRILLSEQTWNVVSFLGSRAFETIDGEVVKVALSIITNADPNESNDIILSDSSECKSIIEKQESLKFSPIHHFNQNGFVLSPGSRINLLTEENKYLLSNYVSVHEGSSRGDTERFDRKFWEVPIIETDKWSFLLNSPKTDGLYNGREHIFLWEGGKGILASSFQARIRGTRAWGKRGIFVARTGDIKSTLSLGDIHAQNGAVLIPNNLENLSAIWAYCQSVEYKQNVKKLSNKIIVPSGTLAQVFFDLQHWQKVAEEMGPLPEPHSDDPTQWLFKGHPAGSEAPLQVAVARLLGYHWPQQEADGIGHLADEDGIVCLPAIAHELPAEERLRALLAAAYGDAWNAATQGQLLSAVKAKNLGTWLRDDFFKQHCALFHNRPFIWQVWDGLKDGFSALLNYHKLDAARLDKLIYTYLGAWIETQRAAVKANVPAADGLLVAALNLQQRLIAIRTGEPLYDIYVRWKPLHQQPLGWEPDLNDGVRLNIRPFVEADVLRAKFTINWNKDRGTNPDGSERHNDLHYTLAQKQAAREQQR